MTASSSPVVLGRRAFCGACAVAGSATGVAFALTPAMPAVAANPSLVHVALQGGEEPVRLQSLDVDVEIAGGAAATRLRMVFFNPNRRILEGKLQFPLAANQIVSGFALDVDGRMRNAVPVEKTRAEQVFEDISRRRVDPGLLQTTVGNTHELRIYPLPPGGTRTVELRIVEPAGAKLLVPLAFAERVADLAVTLRVPSSPNAPTLVAPAELGLQFEPMPSGGFVARQTVRGVRLPSEPIALVLPEVASARVSTEERDGERYFALELPVATRTASRRLPARVQIVWDASGSGAQRRTDRELALLDAYVAAGRDLSVRLVRVADVAEPPLKFEIRDGDWRALRRELERTVYDGASNLAAVRHDGVSQEALWFTDGIANYGASWRPAFPVPVYAIRSAANGDPAALQALADRSGGRSIDLVTSTADAARDALLRRGSSVVAIDARGARDVVVQPESIASGRLVAAGVLTADRAQVALRLRDADGKETTRFVVVQAGRNASELPALQWARLTLASLAAEPRANRARIRALGQRFALATAETSLVVLERVDDYVRHEIAPPAELREAYERLAATVEKRRATSDAERLADVVRRFEARVAWWQREFPKGDVQPLQIATTGPGSAGSLLARESVQRPVADAANALHESRDERERAAASPPAPMPLAPAAARFAATDAATPAATTAAAKARGNGDASAASTITIAIAPAARANSSIERLRNARGDEWQRIYVEERSANATNVGFFLDAADVLLANPDGARRAQGLRALSNLAELDLQNRQVLRLLAYRLQQAGATDLALPILERVAELAPHEPQSHRDLGLALAELRRPQEAIDRLWRVVVGAWDARFADIDLIALAEMNAIIEKARRDGRAVDTTAIDRRLLRNLPLDVRVVLAWDADNTDVDLHVFDPNGEEVYYGYNLSTQGGAITHDATGGYGPEEFALRIAKPGKYRVVANFFGHRQQVLTSGTGLMLWLSSGFGTPTQQDRRTTVRVKSASGERVAIGEFEVAGHEVRARLDSGAARARP